MLASRRVGGRLRLVAGTGWLLFAHLVLAQSGAAQEPGVVVTIMVRDASERPIAEAITTLEGHGGAHPRTNPAGRAAFVAVAAGRYRLRVVRAGYRPIVRQVDVAAADTTLVLVMEPTAARLAEVQVIASRVSGVFGKVGRASDWTPVPGATVTVYGGGATQTDSSGSFASPALRPGAHLLRVSHPDFVARMRSVTVPQSGAVELAILLDSGRTPPLYRRVLTELDQRQRWRGFDSAVIPAEELMRFGNPTLAVAIGSAPSFLRKGLTISGNACVFVDGEPKPGWPLEAFTADQVEAVEVYGGNRSEMSGTLRKRWPPGATCGASPPPPRSLSTAGQRASRTRLGAVTMVVIWLKPVAPR